MKKIIINTVAAVLCGLVILIVFKNIIIRFSAEHIVEHITGLQLRMESLKVGILKPVIDIRGLRLMNPPGYEDKQMMDMPEFYVDYDLHSVLEGKPHFRHLGINLEQFTVVKNAKGELNLNALTAVKDDSAAAKAPSQKSRFPVRIDILDLRIGKVVYKDYSKGSKPQVQEFPININQRFTDISDGYSVVRILIVKALKNTAIAQLTDLPMRIMEGDVSGILSGAQNIVGSSVLKTLDMTKGVSATLGGGAVTATKAMGDKAVKGIGGAVSKVGNVAGALEGALAGPFGGKKSRADAATDDGSDLK
ncbi:MAG: hypothetical protein ABH885_04920 [Candidatus Omnitrophota bacterium]